MIKPVNEVVEEFRKQLLTQDRTAIIDAIVAEVEGMKAGVIDSGEFGAGQYTAFDDVLTHLLTLKQQLSPKE